MSLRQVLVLNAGSSSLKFQLFNAARDALTAVVHGNVQRIGDEERSNVREILRARMSAGGPARGMRHARACLGPVGSRCQNAHSWTGFL